MHYYYLIIIINLVIIVFLTCYFVCIEPTNTFIEGKREWNSLIHKSSTIVVIIIIKVVI